MLYLDSSALAKRYLMETGSTAVDSRLSSEEKILTSVITFAEIHAAVARKYRRREFNHAMSRKIREQFARDWHRMQILEADLGTMAGVPQLVDRFPLRAADAIHLATALWAREQFAMPPSAGTPEELFEFGAADLQLIRIAEQCGLSVFNPEKAD